MGIAVIDPLQIFDIAAMLSTMHEVFIDCAGVTAPDEFWQRYIDAAKPEGASIFGRTLDAFWDALEGGGPGWPGEVKLVFKHSHHLDRSFLMALKSIADRVSVVDITFE